MKLLILLSFIVLALAEDCHPKCRWQCDDPVCPALCHPVCERPKCEIQCEETPCAKCTIHCLKPQCEVRCPKDMCEMDDCPKCETVCHPADCHTTCEAPEPKCMPACEPTKCDWNCKKPSTCPRPKCELNCEAAKCGPGDQQSQCCDCSQTQNAQAAVSSAGFLETQSHQLPSLLEVMDTARFKSKSGLSLCCPCG